MLAFLSKKYTSDASYIKELKKKSCKSGHLRIASPSQEKYPRCHDKSLDL